MGSAPRRILIIDDEPMMREMVCQALTFQGYQTIVAANGREALRINENSPSDLAITDILMPEKEGLETIRELRRQSGSIKIIAMSGGGVTGQLNFLEAAGKLGAHDTLQKPFTLDELYLKVAALIGEGVEGPDEACA